MSKERILFDAIGTYLDKQTVDKSAMPFPKGQDRYGLPKKEDSWGGLKDLRRGVEAIRVGASRVNPKSEEPSDVQKAKPKVLKPGTPEHDRAMAEMEAAKEAKRPKNPAGETASPSSPSSRTRFGDRPLVGGLDKADGLGQKDDYFKYGTREARGDQFGRKADFQTLGGQQGGGVKLTSEEKAGEVYAKDPKLVKKSMDLEEGSRSWAYQG